MAQSTARLPTGKYYAVDNMTETFSYKMCGFSGSCRMSLPSGGNGSISAVIGMPAQISIRMLLPVFSVKKQRLRNRSAITHNMCDLEADADTPEGSAPERV